MSELNEAQALAAALGNTTEPPLSLRNQELTIAPLTIDQISEILLSIDRLAEKGVKVDSILNPDPTPSLSYTQLILRGGKDFRDILATASNQSREFVGSLNLLETAQLAGKIWTVNKDFFDQNQVDILLAFGLDESHLTELKKTFASIKSLVISAPAESETSDASPSEK